MAANTVGRRVSFKYPCATHRELVQCGISRYPRRHVSRRLTNARSIWRAPSWHDDRSRGAGLRRVSRALFLDQLGVIADVYDAEVGAAVGDDIRVGSTSTRVVDFVNRGPLFDPLYVYPPLLDAAVRTVGPAIKLSSLHARTLLPGPAALDIHVDVERGSPDWPLLGFIFMIDAFTPDNGATRFIAGSHRWSDSPRDVELTEYAPQLESACGPAGSLLVFNGSAWHGQGVNNSDRPRRSLQGAFIPRGGRASTDFSSRMTLETRARLSGVARCVLAIPDARPVPTEWS